MPEAGKIIRITDWIMLDELKKPVEAKRVIFSYPDGQPTHVDVAVVRFTAENVRAAIDAAIGLWNEAMRA